MNTALAHNDWKNAERIVKELTGLSTPSSFLINQIELSGKQLNSTAKHTLRTMLNNHQYRARIHYALMTLFPTEYNNSDPLSIEAICSKLSAGDHQALATAVLTFQLLKKRVHPDFAGALETEFQEMGEAGMLLGSKVPELGIGMGLLIGILRPLCLALLSQQAGFQQYVRSLRKRGRYFDINAEKEHFGCSHAQVAALLLTKLGFRRQVTLELFNILEGVRVEQPSHDFDLKKAAIKAIEEVIHPSGDEDEGVGINNEELREINNLISPEILEELRARPSKTVHAWMQKEAKDANEKIAPDLFEKPSHTPLDIKAPEHILNEFSCEELSSFRQIVSGLMD